MHILYLSKQYKRAQTNELATYTATKNLNERINILICCYQQLVQHESLSLAHNSHICETKLEGQNRLQLKAGHFHNDESPTDSLGSPLIKPRVGSTITQTILSKSLTMPNIRLTPAPIIIVNPNETINILT